MRDGDEITVQYKREGEEEHVIFMGSNAFPDIKINYSGIPQEERGGTSVRLLCASALYCFTATFGAALAARGAHIKSLTGRATGFKKKDEIYRTKIAEICIQIEVDVDEKDDLILKKCEEIMKRGCLVTYSLEEAMNIEYNITRVKK